MVRSELGLPPGFSEVAPGVYEGPLRRVGPGVYEGRVRVHTGSPDPDDESHDCDAMGCRWEHVLRREVIEEGGDPWMI